MAEFKPRLTYMVDLPGGQERLHQAILYVSTKCQNAKRFGGIKLNKIIWRADFESFLHRGQPVTGRAYQRLRLGPAPKEMLPVHRAMIDAGLIKVDIVDFGEGIIERRTVPLEAPDPRFFDDQDLGFLDDAVAYYWDLTGMETSDESHGMAWKTRSNGDPMPYESAYLSDRNLTNTQREKMEKMICAKGWVSD